MVYKVMINSNNTAVNARTKYGQLCEFALGESFVTLNHELGVP